MENQIEIYKTLDGNTSITVQFEKDTVWLSQKMMAELFDKDSDTIGLHLKNIYSEEELTETATTELFSVVQTEGKRQVKREIRYYNLDAILSVGYRVNSKRGTQFRQWATQRLKDYLVQGYAINEKRLAEKQMQLQTLKTGIRILSRAIEAQGAACFLYFLEKNKLLFNTDNLAILSNKALASLTLFVASSKPEEMETVRKLTISLLNRT